MTRRRVSTGVAVAILLGVAWWLGRMMGQHRRARCQMGVAPVTVFPVRPGDRWRPGVLDSVI